MADRLSPDARSRLMARIRSRNTIPELRVRSILHRLGFRFRLHKKDLPGTPDIVLVSRRTVIFVHGCFWHGHSCKVGKMPKSRIEYWEAKIETNRRRDALKRKQLRKLNWKVLTIWECELKAVDKLERKLDKKIRLT
ncbi:very short patch repair endonuclease [Lysobacter sp. Root690]|uniref:very short patch repair endonuclease n=1 Tax=Lysobacter sp. Root690 TaxID=1736588 RepID=UPI0006FB2221|nr:very short patch repair endonuclease [Lysobacter sp. Root690]KRB03554.1 endonuclease [Lysobacter sp. Root690]